MSKDMVWHELPPRNPPPPRIIDYSKPQLPPPVVPAGLRETITLLPGRVMRAVFEELSGGPRQIPAHTDEMFIKPGRSIGASCTFELPAIGEPKDWDKRKLEITNLTHNTHKIVFSGDLGAAKEIRLNGIGANVRFRVIHGSWVVVGLYQAEVK